MERKPANGLDHHIGDRIGGILASVPINASNGGMMIRDANTGGCGAEWVGGAVETIGSQENRSSPGPADESHRILY
jgi:hypothetical protein